MQAFAAPRDDIDNAEINETDTEWGLACDQDFLTCRRE
jgi:hypothetical protein